jgi:hypothetical protein
LEGFRFSVPSPVGFNHLKNSFLFTILFFGTDLAKQALGLKRIPLSCYMDVDSNSDGPTCEQCINAG